MGTMELVSALSGRVEAVGVVVAVWTVFEVLRTWLLWRWPVLADGGPELKAVSDAAGISHELEAARGHRRMELGILGTIGVFQLILWILTAKEVLLLRWFGYAICCASLLLVAATRKRAWRRLRAANARTEHLLAQALAVKADRSECEGDS